MSRMRLRAAFYRGGTSKAVVLNGADLPQDRAARDRIFLHVMGSPDAFGRQLDGMGGGISSLSKIVIVEPSEADGADVDYTFVQIAVEEAVADYGGMCGNMASAVGPFAVEEGLVPARDGLTTVRVRNTNTDKIFHATFEVRNGMPLEEGELSIPGVSGTGATVELTFLDPGGAKTGKLLPSGRARDMLTVEGLGEIVVSLVDASNPVVFVPAERVGLNGSEMPADLDADADLMDRLERIRRAASVAMGLSATPETAIASNPKVAIVAGPRDYASLDGAVHGASDYDIAIRIVSMGKVHRAITLSGAICVAVATKVPGSLLADLVETTGDVRIGNPSGVLLAQADVGPGPDGPQARTATAYRTQRRIMEGAVLYPARLLSGAS